MDKSRIPDLIRGSFLFVVALDRISGRTVGMGRAISDGIADAYLQDLVVLPEGRRKGVGKKIAHKLLEGCKSRGIKWIGLIAEPGTEAFYQSLGFKRMEGYTPMLHGGDTILTRPSSHEPKKDRQILSKPITIGRCSPHPKG